MFGLLFDDIVAELNRYAVVLGSGRHHDEVWAPAKSTLMTCGKGDASGDGCWWDFEKHSRVSMIRCSRNVRLLIWLGQ